MAPNPFTFKTIGRDDVHGIRNRAVYRDDVRVGTINKALGQFQVYSQDKGYLGTVSTLDMAAKVLNWEG